MCTAIRFSDRLFGRTYDYERSFGEELTVTPRGRARIGEAENRYAIMGIGVLEDGFPLYFDGVNEWGLTAAALNFPRYAVYRDDSDAKARVQASHLITLILGFSKSVEEVKGMVKNITLIDNEGTLGKAPLHWIVSDPRQSVVIESVERGLFVYDNPLGVLTNSPELPYHLTRLADFSALSPKNPEETTSPLYSRGMGAMGLPGDYSSSSRFVRAAFLKKYAQVPDGDGIEGVNAAFDIMSAVSVPRGAVLTEGGAMPHTRYTAVIDMEKPSYYLTTAACRTVGRLRLSDSLSEGSRIMSIPIYREQSFIEL